MATVREEMTSWPCDQNC